MIKCTKCKESKEIQEFDEDIRPQTKNRFFKKYWCKLCCSGAEANRYLENTDKIKKLNLEWQAANKEKVKEYKKRWREKHRGKVTKIPPPE